MIIEGRFKGILKKEVKDGYMGIAIEIDKSELLNSYKSVIRDLATQTRYYELMVGYIDDIVIKQLGETNAKYFLNKLADMKSFFTDFSNLRILQIEKQENDVSIFFYKGNLDLEIQKKMIKIDDYVIIELDEQSLLIRTLDVC